MNESCFAIPTPEAAEAAAAALAERFEGIRTTASSAVFAVMDSFDWRLFNKGLLVFRTDREYTIVDIHSGRTVHAVTASTGRLLRFHGDFPDSSFAAELKKTLDMRALLGMAEVARQSVQHDLLNGDRKTVARVIMETSTADGGAHTVGQCRVVPLRGYAGAGKQVVAALQQMGLTPVDQPPIATLLAMMGLSPGAYTSKISVALTPEMPAHAAVRTILTDLSAVMHANLPGIREDIDSEFLHDFRVSVRRARSLLGQLKGVLDADTTARLQRQLKAMGAVTGEVRDLDVYLLKKDAYLTLVPDVLQPGMDRLFQSLQRQRRRARQQMLAAMAGDAFTAALSDLEGFVRSDPTSGSTGPAGDRSIAEVAKTVIYQRYRRVVKKGRRIDDATPDEKLHRLRIDCKKLRYLLEFFASLFPADPMQALIKQLKQLQENLGDFNDLSVQQAFLTDYLQAITPRSAQAVVAAAATGGLITRLALSHRQVRAEFLSVFQSFDSPANRKRFKALFA